MKVFISADIEGVAGASAWDDARKGGAGYGTTVRQMTAEVVAACEGALAAGATEIVVKDAHGDARNLQPGDLPPPAQLVRGYNGHPLAMVQELDASFAAAVFVGFHARGGAGGNPLAHTLSSRNYREVRLDGRPVSEFTLHAHAAGMLGVPVALVTGDRALCDEVAATEGRIRTLALKWGHGATVTGLHPRDAVDAIRAATHEALSQPSELAVLAPPEPVTLEVAYVDQSRAFARSFYPGAELVDPHTVRLRCEAYFDVLRALIFLR